MAFIMLRYVPSMPAFWRFFIIDGSWILSKASSASIEIIIYPLQCSCLEHPMDRGAWWAIVHGITKSWTQLSDFHCDFKGAKCLWEKSMFLCIWASYSSLLLSNISFVDMPWSAYTFSCHLEFELLSALGYYGWSCHENSPTSLSVSICFHLSQENT